MAHHIVRAQHRTEVVMGRRRKNSKPKRVVLDPLTARAIRGPHKKDPTKWYWRISRGRDAAGCLWATRDEVTKEVASRVAGIETPEENPAPKTFGELADRWLEQQVARDDLVPQTIRSWKNVIRRLKSIGGKWALDTVKHKFHLFRDKGSKSKNTLMLHFRLARRVMKYGELRDWCSAVVPDVPLRGREPARRTPTAARAEAVLNLIERMEYRVAFTVLRITGCRGVAIERLTWEEVDYERRELTLMGKGGRKRDVPVPEHLLELLKTWQAQQGNPKSGKVFCDNIHDNLRVKIKRTCEKGGINHFSLHGLRRLRVREYRRGGVDVVVAASLLGHSPMVMMRMYDKASAQEKHDAMARLWAKESEDQAED